MNESTIKAIQGIIGTTQDGIWGPKSQAALESIIHPKTPVESSPDESWQEIGGCKYDHGCSECRPSGIGYGHKVKASSFADPKDVQAFRRCKDRGGSDQDCFKVGDNGVGCWGDDVTEGHGASCALPPDDMIAQWGSVGEAKHKLVEVEANGKTVTCVLRDRMPWKKNITNGAGIDLNPDAVRALGLEPPIMVSATWRWA